MDKKIVFKARSKTDSLVQAKPFPAVQALPDWWKNATPFEKGPDNPDGKKFILRDRVSNSSFKRCTPMFDAISSGYIIPLWADVQVTQNFGDIPLITWRTRNNVFEVHGRGARDVPPPPGYDNHVFKYCNAWIPQTPKGYSCLITSPYGYQDLPFKVIPGIVDTDKSTLELVFPVWIKSGLEGVVEHGTPLVQIIPFKRDEWKAEFTAYEDGEYYGVIEETNFNKNIVSHYKRNVWSKKIFQ